MDIRRISRLQPEVKLFGFGEPFLANEIEAAKPIGPSASAFTPGAGPGALKLKAEAAAKLLLPHMRLAP